MHTDSSASSTCFWLKSAVECTATVLMPELAARAQDAQRDFAAIGDDDFFEHGVLLTR